MNFVIWDLDGTLIDSYTKINDTLYLLFKELGLDINKEDIYKYIKINSVHDLLNRLSMKYDNVHELYNQIYNRLDYENKLINNANYILEYLNKHNYYQIIYTHKGLDTFKIIKDLDIDKYFIEVITANNGFKRKPDPEVMKYLRNKYNIDKAYYVGDRLLDMEFAYNSQIDGILYLDNDFIKANNQERYIINNLKDIDKIL